MNQETKDKIKKAIARGKAFESRIVKYLNSLGWFTEKARPVWTFFGGVARPRKGTGDFFHAFDVVAIHPLKDYTLFIQATISENKLSEKRKKVDAIQWNLAGKKIQVWLKDDSRGRSMIRVHEKRNEGWQEIFFRMKDNEFPAEGIL